MTVQARVDCDVIFHDQSGSVFTLGAASEHIRVTPSAAVTISGSVGTAAVSLTSSVATLSTLAIKNTGANLLRVAGAFNVPAGRMAVLPVTATVTVASVSGTTDYVAVWIG